MEETTTNNLSDARSTDNQLSFFQRNSKRCLKILFLLLVLLALFYLWFFTPPNKFPADEIQRIEEGASLRKVSLQFQENHLVKSRLVFETLVMLFEGERRIIAGYYYFERPLSVWKIAQRVSRGERDVSSLKVTIPEGLNRIEISNLIATKLPLFDRNLFLQESKDLEGYLFPDTYFFLPEATAQDVIDSMNKNYEQKITDLREEIVISGKSENEIITMASIIEKEAKGDQDRKEISGILWKRIDIGIALQVDASPDTYKERGLPDRPITNPGLKSIEAALFPIESKYLYYLHDKDGVIHYARSYDEHKVNIAKYLR